MSIPITSDSSKVEFPKRDPESDNSSVLLQKPPSDVGMAGRFFKTPAVSAKAEGSTLGKVGKMLLRGGAGVAGSALYTATALAVGTAGALVLIPGFIITAPAAIVGTLVGAAVGSRTEAGAAYGAKMGAVAAFAPLAAVEAIATLPKLALCHTVGKLGAGLMAYSLHGEKNVNTNTRLLRNLTDLSSPIFWFYNHFW